MTQSWSIESIEFCFSHRILNNQNVFRMWGLVRTELCKYLHENNTENQPSQVHPASTVKIDFTMIVPTERKLCLRQLMMGTDCKINISVNQKIITDIRRQKFDGFDTVASSTV